MRTIRCAVYTVSGLVMTSCRTAILGRVNRCSFAYVVHVCMCATACACVCRCMQAAREEGSTEQIHDWHNLADQAICNGPAVYNLAMHAPKLYQSELRHSIQITEHSRIY